MRCVLLLVMICWSPLSGQQSPLQWQGAPQTDALRGTKYMRFVLTGKFLTPPRQPTIADPLLIVECIPGKRLRVYGGTFLDAYVSVGAVLNSVVSQDGSGVLASYRLDDGKIKQELWSPSTDGTAAFFASVTLNTLLYGHFLPHKAATNPAIQKAVIAVNEYLAGEVVMQFDMPDPTEVADACGGLVHKR